MNQEWNKGISLKPKLVEKCKEMKPVDIMVGVLCKDVEATVLNVLNVINEGLYRYFPDYKKAIVVCCADSSDRTDEAVDLFQPYNTIEKIITSDITDNSIFFIISLLPAGLSFILFLLLIIFFLIFLAFFFLPICSYLYI